MSGPLDAIHEAKTAVKKYLQHGVGAKESAEAYSNSGAKYDEYMKVLNYGAPRQVAKIVTTLMRDQTDARILDVGAGSGLAGEELSKKGYTNMDAVDPAVGLLEIAKARGIYGQTICQFVGEDKMPFEDNSYDLAVVCGAMGENHIPKSGVLDIIRVVKPGGYIVNVFREAAIRVPWYEEGLEPFLQQLEKDRKWALFSRATFPGFLGDAQGLSLVHRVL